MAYHGPAPMYPIPSETLSERKALPTTEEQGNRNEPILLAKGNHHSSSLSHGYAMIHMETEYFIVSGVPGTITKRKETSLKTRDNLARSTTTGMTNFKASV